VHESRVLVTAQKVYFTTFRKNKMTHYAKNIEEDFISKISTKDSVSIETEFTTEGNHLLAFNNTNKFIELKADKFNEYLRSEGMDNIIKLRKKQGKEKQAGREFYQRCVKTLFQVGKNQDDTFSKNTGMRLEIIPIQNPYAEKEITFKILFDNQVVTNALVLAWHHKNGKTTMINKRSKINGEVKFTIENQGRWMISTVRMIPINDNPKADYQSFWGSYTFGFY
jgi:uncharacterized GH25 family protein